MRVVHIGHAPLMSGHPDFEKMVVHPGRWALNLAIAQKKYAGLDVQFVTQIPGASAIYQTVVDGVPVHYIAAPNRLRAATLFAFDVRRISDYVRSLAPAVVHAHGTEDAYALAGQACRAPCVITAQGCYFIINREFPPRLISRARAIQVAEWIALKRANHVIAKSSYVRDELARAFPKLTLHQIPNTVDPGLLDIPFDRPRREGHIAFVGTLVERKGVHILREALRLVEQRSDRTPERRVTLHIFGNRPDVAEDSYEARELAMLRALMGDRLILHGTIPSIQVADELSTIALLVAPSIEEMFGNQFIEALVVGARSVVTDGTAMAENSRFLDCGSIVPQNDPAKLAEAIIEGSDARTGVGDRAGARARVLDFVGPQSIAQKHAELYRLILANRRHPRGS